MKTKSEAKVIRVSNRGTSALVAARVPFKTDNNTMAGIWVKTDSGNTPVSCLDPEARYVVYSYGLHFPMYIYDNATQRWYGNESKYSVTTTRHQMLARRNLPTDGIQWMSHAMMLRIARGGLVDALIQHVNSTACETAGLSSATLQMSGESGLDKLSSQQAFHFNVN